MNTIAMVAEFHEAFGQPSAKDPTIPHPPDGNIHGSNYIDLAIGDLDSALSALRSGSATVQDINGNRVDGDRRCLRLALLTEELRELALALRDDDLAGTLDALVDIRYVTDGTVVEFGLHTQSDDLTGPGLSRFERAFRRVHGANMAKLGPDGKPVIDATGKIKKPEGWTHPDLSDLVKP